MNHQGFATATTGAVAAATLDDADDAAADDDHDDDLAFFAIVSPLSPLPFPGIQCAKNAAKNSLYPLGVLSQVPAHPHARGHQAQHRV